MPGSRKVVRLVPAPEGARTPAPRDDPSDDDEALLRGLREGESWAERALLERHIGHVERILVRILGGRADLDDLAQEVFVRAFERLDALREAPALRAWLTAITVFVAREAIRRRRRRRWLVFGAEEPAAEMAVPEASHEARAALRAFHEVVATLDADKRIAFTLRFVEGMELYDIAEACGVSLATIKRWLRSASADFHSRGKARAELAEWFEGGTRWR